MRRHVEVLAIVQQKTTEAVCSAGFSEGKNSKRGNSPLEAKEKIWELPNMHQEWSWTTVSLNVSENFQMRIEHAGGLKPSSSYSSKQLHRRLVNTNVETIHYEMIVSSIINNIIPPLLSMDGVSIIYPPLYLLLFLHSF